MGLGVRFKEMEASGQAYALGGAAYSFNGRALAFTLNLDADTDAKAKRQANPAGWLLARIRRELEAKGLPAHVALPSVPMIVRQMLPGSLSLRA